MSAVMLSTHDFRTSKHFGLTKMTPSLYMFSIYNILCTLSPISKCQSGPQSSDCQSDMTVWGVTLKCFWAEFRPNLHTVPKTTFWRGAAKNNRWVTALSPKAKKAKVYSKLLNGVGCAGLKSTRVKVHRKSTEPFKSLCLQCRLSLWIQHISFFETVLVLTVQPWEAQEESILKKKKNTNLVDSSVQLWCLINSRKKCPQIWLKCPVVTYILDNLWKKLNEKEKKSR